MHLRLRVDQLTRAAVLVVAVATSAAAWTGGGVGPWSLATWLATHGALPIAAALGWLVLAPLPLAAAAFAARWSPWPWIVAVTIHLAVPVMLLARFPHLLPGWAWGAVALSVVVGLGSVVTAFPDDRPGS